MIEAYLPKHAKLQKYIRHIYLQKNDDQEFVVFPNVGAAITLYENANFSQTDQGRYRVEQSQSFQAVLHTMRTSPIQIVERGTLNKISIVFYPLGVNHFVDSPFCNLVQHRDRSCIPCPLHGQEVLTKSLASSKDHHEKITSVENWLLQNLNYFNEPILKQALAQLNSVSNELSIQALCKKLNVTARTMNRLFEKHVCITPGQYRLISIFRNSLATKLDNDSVDLHELSYVAGFYDASHLIRVFKKYAGYKPSVFFKKMEKEVFGRYILIKN